MIELKEEATLVGIAELRREIPRVLRRLKSGNVVLMRRTRPVGVVMDFEAYQRMKAVFDQVEDLVLGALAETRLRRRGRKTITLREAERRVGL